MEIVKQETRWKKLVQKGVMRKSDQLFKSCKARIRYFEVYLQIPVPTELITTFEKMQLIEAQEKARRFKKAIKRRKKPPGTGPKNRFGKR